MYSLDRGSKLYRAKFRSKGPCKLVMSPLFSRAKTLVSAQNRHICFQATGEVS